MAAVSSPLPRLSSPPLLMSVGGSKADMDHLLGKLKENVVELMVQGDEVTRQLWQMYSVFEDVFGRQTMTTSSDQPLRRVVAGLQRTHNATTPPHTTAGSASNATSSISPPKDVNAPPPERSRSTQSPQNKSPPPASIHPPLKEIAEPTAKVPGPEVKMTPDPLASLAPSALDPTSNPLLDTIGALASTNVDSDDSDLDMVYQQLKYRGRQRRPEQSRLRPHHKTHRHQHQQGAVSEGEGGYAGSNSVDSGYKSLCATPEVCDVRRDPASSKRHIRISDVTLDHLMYLRQSLRKDPGGEGCRSPCDSLASSSATCSSSGFRDASDLSPRATTDEEFRSARSSPLHAAEYYDLESISEFPAYGHAARPRYQPGPTTPESLSERQLSSLYRRRSNSAQSADGSIYGHAPRPPRHASVPRPKRDSKLTEAAIRVLEMIEDFRMEEALGRTSGRTLVVPSSPSGSYASAPLQAPPPLRYRRHASSRSGGRPASTGSLLEHELDARSVASSYAASAEHHVYEEIMYDLVCERAALERVPPPIPPPGGRVTTRTRLLPVTPPLHAHVSPEARRLVVRSHKHSSSSSSRGGGDVYSMGGQRTTNMDRFLEMEWRLAQERRESLMPDFPI